MDWLLCVIHQAPVRFRHGCLSSSCKRRRRLITLRTSFLLRSVRHRLTVLTRVQPDRTASKSIEDRGSAVRLHRKCGLHSANRFGIWESTKMHSPCAAMLKPKPMNTLVALNHGDCRAMRSKDDQQGSKSTCENELIASRIQG